MGMRPFVNPQTGRLEMPAEPVLTASQRRAQRWSIRMSFAVAVIGAPSLIVSLSRLPKPYDQLQLASILFGLALCLVVVGLGIWAIRHEK